MILPLRMKSALAVLLLVGALASCRPPAPSKRLRYAATVAPLVMILQEVVGERAEVVGLLPVGASPHTYEPRPSEVRAAETATALFYVAPTLDAWAARLPSARKIEVLELVPKEFRLPAVEAHEEAAGEASETTDPHFWTDPLTVRAILPALARALGDLDPEGRPHYASRAEDFARRLDALHAELEPLLAPVVGRPVFLFHPSFQYLLHRYGLVLSGVVEPLPGKEPTPRDLQRLVEQFRRAGAKAVFNEPQLPRRSAAVLAEAVGSPVFELDPNGGVPGRDRYADLLRWNARALLEALR